VMVQKSVAYVFTAEQVSIVLLSILIGGPD
jgi:hypothetical protein